MLQNLFGMEGPVWKFFNRSADLILLGILWFAASIPLFTIGASTTAAYYVALSMVRKEEGYLWRGFWKSFRQNFKQATAAWLIVAAATAFFGMDIYYYMNQENAFAKVMVGLFFCLGIALLLVSLYLFAVISRFSNPLKRQFTSSFFMTCRHINRTIPLAALTVGYVALCWKAPVSVFLGFGVYVYVGALLLNPVFGKYEKAIRRANGEIIEEDEEEVQEDSEQNNSV